MSNHFSADYLKSPGDDRRLDITDVFLFKSSQDLEKMVLARAVRLHLERRVLTYGNKTVVFE